MPRTRRATTSPGRRLGQNFLADPRVAERLVDAFEPRRGDLVVEIGPGRGAMTRRLAERAGRFVALELDERLIPALEHGLAGIRGAEVRHADAVRVDWSALSGELGGALRVIGNLPYNVGTAIVRRLLASDAILDAQIVLQLEVAGRLLARHGSKSFGPISVVTALRCRGRRLATLSPSVFRPRPKVRSAVVALQWIDDPPLAASQIPDVERWLFRGFGQRRKTLAGNLAEHREFVRRFLADHELPHDARAEAVPAETWLALVGVLRTRTDAERDIE